MLHIADLHFRYADGGFTLGVSDLRVGEGERVALVGPSGSGKTTLLHLIAGILKPASGSIRIGTTDVARLSEAERRAFRVQRIGLVFQSFELLEYLDVLDNILLPCRLNAALSLDDAARDRARALADRLGLADKLDRHPGALSQGERQRVAICRALIAGPQLILADEPTGNLDPDNKSRAVDALLAEAAAHRAACLTVTHDHSLLEKFDRVIDLAQLAGASESPA